MADPGPHFGTAVVSPLTEKDFRGRHVDVAVAADGITFKGEVSGFLHVSFAQIAKMRVGFFESETGKAFQTRVWLDGEDKPLRLLPVYVDDDGAYVRAVRAIAARLQADGALARVESGTSKIDALIAPVMFGFVAAAAIVISIIVGKTWWEYVVIPLVPTIVTGVLIWNARRYHWPRQVKALGDLDRQLP